MSRQRQQPRSTLPSAVLERLAPRGIWLSSGGPEGSFLLCVDLGAGRAFVRRHTAGRAPKTAEVVLSAAQHAEVEALAAQGWEEPSAVFAHPQTVVGGEELILVEGEVACVEDVSGGWFTGGSGAALRDWGQALLGGCGEAARQIGEATRRAGGRATKSGAAQGRPHLGVVGTVAAAAGLSDGSGALCDPLGPCLVRAVRGL